MLQFCNSGNALLLVLLLVLVFLAFLDDLWLGRDGGRRFGLGLGLGRSGLGGRRLADRP